MMKKKKKKTEEEVEEGNGETWGKQGRIHDCSCRGRLGRGSNDLGRGSNARGTVNDWMAIFSVFFSILAHSGIED